MVTAWTVIFIALAYVGVLFAIASHGDRAARRTSRGQPRPFIYALSLAVYCTSWTFFGSVGLAAETGYDFLPLYIGPILMVTVGWPVLRAIVDISKRQNTTSIADFISARYGKHQGLGALVAVIAVVGVVPFIALQLKAVSFSLTTVMPRDGGASLLHSAAGSDLALLVAIAMAGFAALFGTRHVDATEHQDGLILAIAVESMVKLAAFLAVGLFATFWLMGGLGPLLDRVGQAPAIAGVFGGGLDGGRWVTMTLLAMCAIVLLPRQFHVAVVENTHIGDLKRAAWLFPLYLVAINLFVVPIAMTGLLTFAGQGVDPDTYVLALPALSDHRLLTVIALIGGLSAATGMVIVESVALSIMVCNNVVLPLLVRFGGGQHLFGGMGRQLLIIRRSAIAVILILAYSYYSMIGASVALAQTGLLSFAAVVQFAPAFFGGLLWRRGTAAGAMAGIVAGFTVWAYTLLVPSFIDAGWLSSTLLSDGLFGLAVLRPRMLFHIAFDPLTHGVLWSLLINVAAYVAVSFMREPSPIERLQASAFLTPEIPAPSPAFRLWRTAVSFAELQETVARYLGPERTRRAFDDYLKHRESPFEPAAEVDIRTLRFAEHLLASAVGAASSRLVLGLLLERRAGNRSGAMRLLDDASEAIQYNRDLLQSAIDHVRQGIAVFDKNLKLICWNRQFRDLLHLPAALGRVGVALDEVLRAIAARTGTGEAAIEGVVADRLAKLCEHLEPYQERLVEDGSVLDVRASHMPDGGIVVTFADVTDRVRAAEELKSANESLERRVAERTGELVKLNSELARAKAEADAANLGKTRFIAAASHDILQPLNAARLFASSLVERRRHSPDAALVGNLDASLEAVEEILSALLDISRLDAGATKPMITSFDLGELLQALAVEAAPAARDKGVKLTVVPSSLVVRSDRKLLRRILQNLMSNAVKYAPRGRVLVGCRRRAGDLRIEVHDTGYGIPNDKLNAIFLEFERLGPGDGSAPGLGLGLSIVERIARMLGHGLEVRSEPGRGSSFSVTVPLSRDSAAPQARPRRAAPRPGDLAGATVVVIDNEPAILQGMRALIENWHMAVLTARDGDEASTAVAGSAAAVTAIVADYHLEREDGLAVIERLRGEAGGTIPAILITADRTRAVHERAAAQGVIYMRKPVRAASLRAALSHLTTRTEPAE